MMAGRKGKNMKRLLTLAALLVSCTNESDTVRTLIDSGYSDVQTTGWSPWACSKDDTYETGFRAKNPAGKFVEGTVCCGLMTKGCTIRF